MFFSAVLYYNPSWLITKWRTLWTKLTTARLNSGSLNWFQVSEAWAWQSESREAEKAQLPLSNETFHHFNLVWIIALAYIYCVQNRRFPRQFPLGQDIHNCLLGFLDNPFSTGLCTSRWRNAKCIMIRKDNFWLILNKKKRANCC